MRPDPAQVPQQLYEMLESRSLYVGALQPGEANGAGWHVVTWQYKEQVSVIWHRSISRWMCSFHQHSVATFPNIQRSIKS